MMGFISATEKRLVFLPKGTMKSEDYERELKPLIPMLRKHVYVHDNCGAHSKSRNSGYFARQRVKLLLNWPALSPDLNVIESCWAWLTQAVDAANPQGIVALRAAVEKAWADLPQEKLAALCGEFRDRCALCLSLSGGLVTKSAWTKFVAAKRRKQAAAKAKATRG